MFESFDDFINEAGMNDPVLMAFRAAKMKREKELAKPKRKPLYGKQREKAEEALWVISQDLKDLYADRGQLLIDMEQEAEIEGGPVADRYGEQLDMIEDKIKSLIKQRSKLEMKLAESVVNEAKVDKKALRKELDSYAEEIYNDSNGSYDGSEWYTNMNTIIRYCNRGDYESAAEEYLASFTTSDGREMPDGGEYEEAINIIKDICESVVIGEAYDGNMADFKYEFPNTFEDVTGNPVKAIKKISKKGKGFEVRTSTYMSRPEMEEVGKAMNLEVVDYKKDKNIAITVYESVVNENRVTLKRKYTENHPAVTAGKQARIRNKMLEAIADGKLTQEEFKEILKEMTADSTRWIRRNNKYFNVSEEGVSLSKFGRRALNQITINENMDKFIFETFESFINEDIFADLEDAISDMEFDAYQNLAFEFGVDSEDPNMMMDFIYNELDKKGAKLLIKNIKKGVYESKEDNTSENIKLTIKVNEAKLELDAMDPEEPQLLKDLKKYKIKHSVKWNGTAVGFHTMELEGDKKKIKKIVDDHWGLGTWDDYKDYVEESVVNEGLHPELKKAQKAIKKGETVYGENVRFPGRFKILELGNMFAKVDYEDGTKPMEMASMNIKVDSLQFESVVTDSNEAINEAFKSSKLRNLLNMDQSGSDRYGRKASKLAQGLYGISKIKLDELEDADLIDLTPKAAYKEASKSRDFIVFYIVDNEKENPYADKNTYRKSILRPGILAVTRGKDFLGVTYDQHASRPAYDKRGGKTNYRMVPDKDGVGGNKNYKGYDASGIYNVKRAADLADRAIVFDMTIDDKSSKELVQQRADAQSGAIAFKSDKDFKKANMTRYKDILAQKASKLPLDKIVEDAISTLTKHISDGIKKGDKTRYGDLKLGEDKRGRDIKITDASNIMSSILSDYERYVSAVANMEMEKEEGYSSGYYERSSKEYAKSISDRVKKVKNMDYAW